MSDKSYNISAGQTVDDVPGFRVYSYLVDNYTSQYLFIKEPNRFVPPKTVGVAIKTTGDPRVVVQFQSPSGIAQPSSVTGEQASIRVLDTSLPVSAGLGFGLTIPAWLSDGSAQNYTTYPHDADPVTLTSNAAPWTTGAQSVILPAGTLTGALLGIVIGDIGANQNHNFQIFLFQGPFGLNVEIARFGYPNNLGTLHGMVIPTIIPIGFPSGAQLAASCEDNAGGGQVPIYAMLLPRPF